MGFMITIGILTRTLHVLPEAFIAVFYTGLSVALITTGTRFIWYWWRNRHLLVWLVIRSTEVSTMDAVFPSHNVSESLPKETTASPITLSNRISQEMYRLHKLVPLAKRINENHIILRYRFHIGQIRHTWLQIVISPGQVVVIVWTAYSPATLMQYICTGKLHNTFGHSLCVPARRSKPQASYFFQPDNRNHSSSLHFLAFRALLTVLFLVRKYHWENMLSRWTIDCHILHLSQHKSICRVWKS